MPSRRRPRILALLALLAILATPTVGHADPPSAANVASARDHFDRARALYGQGAYREAIAELEAAHELDPSAKDLVFNLGVICEKLADIDGALRWFRLYTTMSLTPAEGARADAYIHRLEGAKRELDQRSFAAPVAPSPPARGGPALAPSSPAPPRPSAPTVLLRGRMDGWTLGASTLSGVGLVFGLVMAVKAVQDQPPSNSLTQATGPTYLDLVNRVDKAHTEAMLADVGFGVALVSAVAAVYLFLSRVDAAPIVPASTRISAMPLERGGGMLLLEGPF